MADAAIDEHDRHLDNLEAEAVAPIVDLDLEGIAV